MIYELRKYVIARGRMHDNHGRMRDHLPPLLARHGVRVVARWSALAGRRLPLFCYLMQWESFAEREAAWAGFYADPEWAAVRAATNAGSELVESYELTFHRPHPAFTTGEGGAARPLGGLHQLISHRIVPGQNPAVAAFVGETYLPGLRAEGAEIVGVLDTISGPDMPNLLILAAWRDETAWLRGWRAFEDGAAHRDACAAQRERLGTTLFGESDVYLLEPAAYALPVGALPA